MPSSPLSPRTTDTSAPRLRRWLIGAVLLAASLLVSARAVLAVTVSPTAVYIDARNPVATMTLFNTGTRPEEIEISFGFGYPQSDSLGHVNVVINDSAAVGEPSIVPWMRVFPRRLVLQPGQRQTIRVMVVPPANLPDGEYWGRVLVRSRGGQAPIEQREGAVTMQVAVQTTMATALFFRKGPVTTGVQVAPRARLAGDTVHVSFDMTRTGSAVWLGRERAEIVAPDGRVIASAEDVDAVYRTLRRNYAIVLPPGTPRTGLVLRWIADNERPDLPPAGPAAGTPVRGELRIQ